MMISKCSAKSSAGDWTGCFSWADVGSRSVCTEAEVVAGRPRPCGKTEFSCSNRRCVPIQLQCDLFSDCGDGGSDEQDCKACKYGTSRLQRTRQRSRRWDEKYQMLPRRYQKAKLSSFCFVIYANTCAPAPAVCFVKDGDAPLAFAPERRSPAGLMCNLPLFVVSSGDVCGKKTNPCGEDAVCNQTNANSICQCKPGFKRNQKTGQCEGNRVSCSFYGLAFNTHWRP